MRCRAGGWLAVAGLLMLARPDTAVARHVVMLPVCGGGAGQSVPLGGSGGGGDDPGGRCATGCHALCQRRRGEGG